MMYRETGLAGVQPAGKPAMPHPASKGVARSALLRDVFDILYRTTALAPDRAQIDETLRILSRSHTGYQEIGDAICNPRETVDFRYRLLSLLGVLGTPEAGGCLRAVVARRDIEAKFWMVALIRMARPAINRSSPAGENPAEVSRGRLVADPSAWQRCLVPSGVTKPFAKEGRQLNGL